MIDSHLHLDAMPAPLEQIRRAALAGVTGAVAVSGDDASWRATRRLARNIAQAVPGWRWWHAYGLHPERERHDPEALDRLAAAIGQGQVDVLGEIGQPYYHAVDQAGRDYHAALSARQLQIAQDRGLPVIVHAVHTAVRPMLESLARFRLAAVVFHWLKASPEDVREIVRLGYYVGITPEVTWRARDQELLAHLRVDRILLETDAPWPHGPHPAPASSPRDLRALATWLDRVHPLPDRGWATQTTTNLGRFLGRTLP
ncbi:MAG: TatD family hydrolase [Thermaerobacter sp.]|nr:TatD family hydrolase [Thermaerobacter sp.]